MSILQNSETLASRAAALRLLSRNLADGMKQGAFRSSFRGQGIEFSDVREYMRGDDIRAIDWNVTARMGKPYVKMFEEERELVIFLVIDRSASMDTGSEGKSRLDTASEAAALLSFAAEQNGIPVGAVFFDGSVEFSVAPQTGKDRTMMLLSKLDSVPERKETGTAMEQALRGAHRLLNKRSLVFILSDFRTAGYESELARLATKHDVIAIRTTDKSDSELPEAGCLRFYDTETKVDRLLPTQLPSFRRAWRESNSLHLNRWRYLCLRRGVTPVTMSTSEDPVAVLARVFSTRRGS